MPGTNRRDIVDPTEVAIYHCWNRCVRGFFMLADRTEKEELREDRRGWVREVQMAVAALFGIEVAFYAILGNHLHLLLRSRPDVVANWSDQEVVRRWLAIARIKRNGSLDIGEITQKQIEAELRKEGRVATLRRRLSHVSWFMGTVCEHVSRRVNAADGQEGTCWSGRFKVRLLVDTYACLLCAMYIDLNVVRAGMAHTPEASRYTSIFDRVAAMKQEVVYLDTSGCKVFEGRVPDDWLCELFLDITQPVNAPGHFKSRTSSRASDKGILPVTLKEYLQLVDDAGRRLVDKKASISASLPPIVERLKIDIDSWVKAIAGYEEWFGLAIGTAAGLAAAAQRLNRKWFQRKRNPDVFTA